MNTPRPKSVRQERIVPNAPKKQKTDEDGLFGGPGSADEPIVIPDTPDPGECDIPEGDTLPLPDDGDDADVESADEAPVASAPVAAAAAASAPSSSGKKEGKDPMVKNFFFTAHVASGPGIALNVAREVAKQQLANLANQLDVRYFFAGFEQGNEGLRDGTGYHWQGFFLLHGKKRCSTVIRSGAWIKQWHLEPMKGTPKSCHDYVTKDAELPHYDFLEVGDRPSDEEGWDGIGGIQKDRWEQARLACKEQRKLECDAELQIRYFGNLEKMERAYMVGHRPDPLDDVCGEWHYGVSGAGKTMGWMKEYKDTPVFVKELKDEYWGQYKNEEIVVIEEVMQHDFYYFKCFLDWAGIAPFAVRVKHADGIIIRPKKLIVTSNISPMEFLGMPAGIKCHPKQVQAFLRRFKVFEYTKPYDGQVHRIEHGYLPVPEDIDLIARLPDGVGGFVEVR